MDYSMPGFPILHQLPKLVQTHVHWVSDTIQPSHPLLSPSPPAFNLSQHQGLFKWVSSSHQVAKELEFQLQHQSFQWIFRTDFLLGLPCGSDSKASVYNAGDLGSIPGSGRFPGEGNGFPLGLTDLFSLLSKGLSRVFFNTTVQKHQFFGTQLSS